MGKCGVEGGEGVADDGDSSGLECLSEVGEVPGGVERVGREAYTVLKAFWDFVDLQTSVL
jgi:hypothetical protein